MGAAASCDSKELMAESSDAGELAAKVAKLIEMIDSDEKCKKFCQPVREKADPSEGDVQGWQERRENLYALASRYAAILEANGGKHPGNVEELIAAQTADGEVNLSWADRDDDEDPGCMYVFEVTMLTAVPDSVLAMGANLTKLSLKKNKLKELPAEVGTLTALASLDVSENELTTLCPEMCSLTTLETLNISENHITVLPEAIGGLTGLQTLIAFKNQLTGLPDEIGQCVALQEVNFFNNKLTKVPNTMADLVALVDLNLGGNKLKTCPSTRKWTNLERLALSWNNIVMLPDVGGMVKLRQLQINRNQLSEIADDALEGCTELEVVDMSTNRFEKLPASLSSCTGVGTLDATGNQLTALPDLSALTSLKIVKLGSNALTEIASGNLHKCVSIETLFVNSNKLTALPAELTALPNLKRMNISDNGDLDRTSDEAAATIQTLSAKCKANKGKWIA